MSRICGDFIRAELGPSPFDPNTVLTMCPEYTLLFGAHGRISLALSPLRGSERTSDRFVRTAAPLGHPTSQSVQFLARCEIVDFLSTINFCRSTLPHMFSHNHLQDLAFFISGSSVRDRKNGIAPTLSSRCSTEVAPGITLTFSSRLSTQVSASWVGVPIASSAMLRNSGIRPLFAEKFCF